MIRGTSTYFLTLFTFFLVFATVLSHPVPVASDDEESHSCMTTNEFGVSKCIFESYPDNYTPVLPDPSEEDSIALLAGRTSSPITEEQIKTLSIAHYIVVLMPKHEQVVTGEHHRWLQSRMDNANEIILAATGNPAENATAIAATSTSGNSTTKKHRHSCGMKHVYHTPSYSGYSVKLNSPLLEELISRDEVAVIERDAMAYLPITNEAEMNMQAQTANSHSTLVYMKDSWQDLEDFEEVHTPEAMVANANEPVDSPSQVVDVKINFATFQSAQSSPETWKSFLWSLAEFFRQPFSSKPDQSNQDQEHQVNETSATTPTELANPHIEIRLSVLPENSTDMGAPAMTKQIVHNLISASPAKPAADAGGILKSLFFRTEAPTKHYPILTNYTLRRQSNPPWGLERVSLAKGAAHPPVNPSLWARVIRPGSITHDDRYGQAYVYPSVAGADVDVYVVDTGVAVQHPEFQGRAKWGVTIPLNVAATDNQGHGTHVAGTIASRTYGVAKSANIIAVKVFDGPGGPISDVVKGLVWAIAEAQKHPERPSTINLSITTMKSQAMNSAVRAAFRQGILVVAAAGNSNMDACLVSTASESTVLSVGAYCADDTLARFSNFGKCVHISAPGCKILSLSPNEFTDRVQMDGTSMAAPHVTGAAAVILSLKGKMDVRSLKKEILDISVQDSISRRSLPDGTPNRILSLSSYLNSTVLIANSAGVLQPTDIVEDQNNDDDPFALPTGNLIIVE